ncbi:glutaredoxin family protein [Massilia brevitalea]|uniref:glutaredoxin family protein n=1 Tax=Massilia brevitalea TaxID=442526 RepID=UPI00273A4946|nr:glutaredoxin family protein [Massilia brevitalea]
MKHLKTIFSYLLIIGAGIAIGTIAPRVPQWLKGDYTEGNYAAYFPNPSTKVVMYGTSTCPYCAKAREYLDQRGIAYADYDVQKSPAAKEAFSKLDGKGVPLILIGNRRIDGFNAPVYDDALKNAGIAPRTVAQSQ